VISDTALLGLIIQFLNVAAVAFDVLRGISFALTISFPLITDTAGVCINWLNDVVATRAYSRKLEEEADAVGLQVSRALLRKGQLS
jgi:Zn-dependent protease with chaperone function